MSHRKHLTSIFSTLLAVSLLITAFCAYPPLTASADGGYYAWSGYSTYLRGAGTEDNPFLISSPNDLAYFRKQVADSAGKITYYANNNTSSTAKTKTANVSFYKLTCDIYYNDPNGDEWKSWTASVAPTNGGGSVHTWASPGYGDETTRRFQGHFDGDGHTIYGLYIVQTDQNCVGFLGTARYATITDLTLSKGFVKGANLVGGFVGKAMVGVDLVNCTSYLRVRGTNGVGGLVGGNAVNGSSLSSDIDITSEASIPSFAVYNCINKASVSGTKFVGGVVGYVSAGAARVQIEKCRNSAAVTADTSCAGGILGGTYKVDGYGHGTVRDCVNSGKITGGTGSFTGGIVGCGRAVDIYSCTNSGTVGMTGKYVGGISGGGNTADALANGKIVNCYNSADVTGTTYAGGIVGVAKSINVNSCANVGNVTGTSYVGGISGRSGGASDKRDTELYDCYNTGSVTSTDGSITVAGIVGEAYCEGTVDDNKYVKVKRCVNIGAVSSGNALAYSTSTLQTADGSGLFVYRFAATCFGLSGVNSAFDGCTEVETLSSPAVLKKLNSETGGTWSAGYPLPTLNGIDYSLQNYNGRSELFGAVKVRTEENPCLSVSVNVNTEGSYYGALSSYELSYGVLAVKKSALADGKLTVDTDGAIFCTGSLADGAFTAVLSGQTADEYGDEFVLRPYVVFDCDGSAVYVYGEELTSSYYGAEGAGSVSAVNETAAVDCTEKIYVLLGGEDSIKHTLLSASREDSLSFVSSAPEVASVSADGRVKGLSCGSAVISVTYTGAWGAKTAYCTVTVLADLDETVYANEYAASSDTLRLQTNTLKQIHNSITKNDGSVLDYNGTVFLIDGGHKNDESLKYLLSLREDYLKDGLESGKLNEAEYYRRLLSDNCKIEIISLITHWHSDHIYALRYCISQSPMVTIKTMYTVDTPSGTTADGYSNYLSGYESMVSAVKTYSPNMQTVKLAYTKSKTLYFGGGNVSAAQYSADTPVKLGMLAPYDWSTNTNINGNNTSWNNCSSVWYVFEFGGSKLLFTGDTYPNDSGTTYTGAITSGSTAVDYMLYRYKDVVDSTVTFLDCNHHGRGAYVENLFTVTQPQMVFSGLYYGQDGVNYTAKAVTTADFYLAGDGAQIFVFDSSGGVDTSLAVCSYSANAGGHAIRNDIPIHYDLQKTEMSVNVESTAPTGITLSADNLIVGVGQSAWLSAVVDGDEYADKSVTWTVSDRTVLATDGAFVEGLSEGTVTITASCNGYSASCTVTVVLQNGDLNSDGMVSAADVILLKLVLTGNADGGDFALKGDLDRDGMLTTADYALLVTKIKSSAYPRYL